MSEKKGWAAPSGFSDADRLRLWRYLLCSNEEFKADWAATLKAQQDKYGKKLKVSENGEIIKIYDKKMATMRTVLLNEQKRLHLDEDNSDDK